MSETLGDLIDDGRVHVVDGSMGTMLSNHGGFVNICYDELNLKQPNFVRDVHAGYVKAGAEILETNTFGANPVKLSGYGLVEQTEAINRCASRLPAPRPAHTRASSARSALSECASNRSGRPAATKRRNSSGARRVGSQPCPFGHFRRR